MLVHDLGRGNLDVTGGGVDLAPVVKQRVLKNHAVAGQEERETGGLVGASCVTGHIADRSCGGRASWPPRAAQVLLELVLLANAVPLMR